MATPGSFPDAAFEARDLGGGEQLAYEEGHDVDIFKSKERSDMMQAQKGTQSQRSTSSGDTGSAPNLEAAHERTEADLVFWDGPDDPLNPMNWSSKKKWGNIAILSAITLITPLASSFFAPGVPQVMATFHETSTTLATFVVSVYLLGFAFGPLLIAPLSEIYGRYPIYNVCNVLFVIFSVACGVSSDFGMLIGFRFLAGIFGSCPLTLGAGTIADLMPQERRAGAMGIWALGPLLGPVVGPVCGGFLSDAKGWRWIFYVLAIFGGFFSILAFFFLRESYAPVILEKKAAKLRKSTGNPNLQSRLASDISPRELFKRSIVRPLKMLLLSPIILLMSIYISINYGILYLLFTTFTFVFEEQYKFSESVVGLTYIGSGIGMIAGMLVIGVLSDRIVSAQKAKGKVKPEDRLALRLTVPGGVALPIGLFIYGWTAEKHTHWFWPIFGTSFIGLGLLTCMMTIQTFLVDAYTIHAASAMAANTVLRSIFGAVLPLCGLSMYNAIGLGWGNSLLGFIAFAMIPVPVFFKFYGERIRMKWPVKL